ncbi:unnamed protein product [Lactuca virosa]|uniref:Bet v I/Major latex protein domain-containing protein n=1 Tax=Lactuca virosa TaxID=75947 RepID=A0AAU9LGA0_9ASTR|nr:unnamed protein product [Lactuca virosa]
MEKETVKDIIEEVDDELHKIVFKVIEGDILDVYNSFSFILTTRDVGDKKFVIWTIEFEKANASIPDPISYLDLVCGLARNIDAHFLNLHPSRILETIRCIHLPSSLKSHLGIPNQILSSLSLSQLRRSHTTITYQIPNNIVVTALSSAAIWGRR